MVIYNVGDKVKFIPAAYSNSENGTPKEYREQKKVTGTVVQVNRQHRWYRVAYPTRYFGIQHECFKF